MRPYSGPGTVIVSFTPVVVVVVVRDSGVESVYTRSYDVFCHDFEL